MSAKVRITTPEQKLWQVSGERPESPLSRVIQPDGGAWSAYKIREPGSETELQLVELRYHPGEVAEIHCHDEDELIYILSGSMVVNNRTLEPGTTMYVAGGVYYGFSAGPEGLHFLNFRGHIDNTYHLPGRRKVVDTTLSH
jgi:mannose-6-phosphate isomerase-like protein (cupin superfamily)